jgi:hypothetical protein
MLDGALGVKGAADAPRSWRPFAGRAENARPVAVLDALELA